jgi:hypothetical protein
MFQSARIGLKHANLGEDILDHLVLLAMRICQFEHRKATFQSVQEILRCVRGRFGRLAGPKANAGINSLYQLWERIEVFLSVYGVTELWNTVKAHIPDEHQFSVNVDHIRGALQKAFPDQRPDKLLKCSDLPYLRKFFVAEFESLDSSLLWQEIQWEIQEAEKLTDVAATAPQEEQSAKVNGGSSREISWQPLRKGVKAGRMTVDDANEKALKLARKLRLGFFALSERQQARQIGCSWTTWQKTKFYKKAKVMRPGVKKSKPRSPKTESLTAGREEVIGEGERNEILEQLIAEAQADNEPSPLENRPRKIHFYKKL